MLVIGGPGGGKSFRVVKPNGYNHESSYVFCDPKGELLRDIGNYLKLQGYRIRVLNLVNMSESDGYNPLAYLRSDEDVVKLVTNLIANTTPKAPHLPTRSGRKQRVCTCNQSSYMSGTNFQSRAGRRTSEA